MFSSVEFLDFNKFPIADDGFADFGHLNYKGASKFSNWFNIMLNSGLLNTDKKQFLINQGISAVIANDKTVSLALQSFAAHQLDFRLSYAKARTY